jgi:hypothetical protein
MGLERVSVHRMARRKRAGAGIMMGWILPYQGSQRLNFSVISAIWSKQPTLTWILAHSWKRTTDWAVFLPADSTRLVLSPLRSYKCARTKG